MNKNSIGECYLRVSSCCQYLELNFRSKILGNLVKFSIISLSLSFRVTFRKMFLKTTLSLCSPPRVQAEHLASKVELMALGRFRSILDACRYSEHFSGANSSPEIMKTQFTKPGSFLVFPKSRSSKISPKSLQKPSKSSPKALRKKTLRKQALRKQDGLH